MTERREDVISRFIRDHREQMFTFRSVRYGIVLLAIFLLLTLVVLP